MKRKISSILFAVFAVTCVVRCFALDVRVRQTPGGPKLFVNGKRHLARSVKVPLGSSLPRHVDVEWQSYDFPVTMSEDKPNGMWLFRFEKKSSYGGVSVPDGWVKFRNFSIVDETGADVFTPDSLSCEKAFRVCWRVSSAAGPYGDMTLETNGVMRVDVRKPQAKDGEWSHAALGNSDFYIYTEPSRFKARKGMRCRVRFEACADRPQEIFPKAYQMPGYLALPVAPDPFDETVRMARDAGVDIVIVTVDASWRRGTWEPVVDVADRAFDRVLSIHPKALLVARVAIRPASWMLAEHPDWRTAFFDGKVINDDSVSCLPWREHSARFLEKLSRHLDDRYPDNFAGIHIAAHRAGEWLYDDMLAMKAGGADVHTRTAWRRFLAELGDPDAATAEVPTDIERKASPDGEMLPDPVKERRLMLFNRFLGREMADRIAELAAVVRKATDGRKLVAFFYGYTFEVASRGAESGHVALEYLLNKAAGDIDFLGGPFSYADRKPPGTRPVMSPADTIARYGVMWWNEDDTRTYRETRPEALQEQGGVSLTKAETLQTLERNNRQNAERGQGYWWVDLMGRGWYLDEDLWAIMMHTRPYEEERLASDEPFAPDVAVIMSEESLIHRRFAKTWTSGALGRNNKMFERAGVSAGQYLFEDEKKRDIPARVRFYLTSWYLDGKDRELLRRRRAERPDLVRVWCYASGYVNEKCKDARNIEDATGFKVRKTASARFPNASPLFAVDPQPGDEVWERYENGEAAIVVRRMPAGGWEIFHAPPIIKPETIKRIVALPGKE